jgi:hypothetical protein
MLIKKAFRKIGQHFLEPVFPHGQLHSSSPIPTYSKCEVKKIKENDNPSRNLYNEH